MFPPGYWTVEGTAVSESKDGPFRATVDLEAAGFLVTHVTPRRDPMKVGIAIFVNGKWQIAPLPPPAVRT